MYVVIFSTTFNYYDFDFIVVIINFLLLLYFIIIIIKFSKIFQYLQYYYSSLSIHKHKYINIIII